MALCGKASANIIAISIMPKTPLIFFEMLLESAVYEGDKNAIRLSRC
jgi:hypothetical protein